MSGGYGLGLIGAFLILSGLVVGWIYAPRAARLNAILSGRGLIAHWQYDQTTVAQQAERDRRESSRQNRGLLLIVAIFMFACTVLFTLIGIASGEGEEMLLFVAMMGGVFAVVAAAAFGMPYVTARHALRSSHEAYIAEGGLYLNGTFHTWKPPLSYKDQVTLVQDAEGARLVFHLRILTGPGWLHYVPYTVEAPVPAGQEAIAQEVVRRLN
jgi:hypothetical protein